MQKTIEPNISIGELVAENLARTKLFEKLGIDYCCGGKRSLSSACQEKNLDLKTVLSEIENFDNIQGDSTDWTKSNLCELVDHIIATYHIKLRADLPRLAALLNKVVDVHGKNHPELIELKSVFVRFRAELEMHMQKEEMVLFPLCKELETSKRLHAFHCGSIANPINVMEFEHESAGNDLGTFARITDNYTPPANACTSFKALYAGLKELEVDMHKHVHLENSVLFPKAIAAESQFLSHAEH